MRCLCDSAPVRLRIPTPLKNQVPLQVSGVIPSAHSAPLRHPPHCQASNSLSPNSVRFFQKSTKTKFPLYNYYTIPKPHQTIQHTLADPSNSQTTHSQIIAKITRVYLSLRNQPKTTRSPY